MSSFAFRPKIKDVDYYLDAVMDLVNNNLGDAKVALVDCLIDEEQAATLNNEHTAANLIQHIRRFIAAS